MKLPGHFKILLSASLVLSLCLPAAVSGAAIHLESDTLLRVFERDSPTEEDAAVAPLYEYLRADFGELDSRGLSFHLYGWGRADLGDGEFYAYDSAGELLYGYIEYLGPAANFGLRLGRQYVFEGVADEAIDGLRLDGDLTPYFSVSAYGGQPVALDSENGRSGDSIWGGRLAHHLGTHYNVGLSYKSVDNDDEQAEESLGVDLSLALPMGIDLYGYSSRNLDTEGWGEHFYQLAIPVMDFHLRPYLEVFEYDHYFTEGANSAQPFRFLAGTEEQLRVYGGDLLWFGAEDWDLGAKVKFYDYDLRGDSSRYYAGTATWRGEDLPEFGGEFGFMEGDDKANDYLLTRAYFYWDRPPQVLSSGFVTGDIVYVFYDEEIYGEDASLFLSLGAGSRFLSDALEIRVSGDYSADPYLEEDLRGMVLAKYAFDR
ncbi:MAG: hypothetical protein C0617_10260 [Desulfuromonas sp.]|uniref:hypothetical protein n=1 Tax=Desulfuromonas sp. TaxID=892 RepID=UPI000CA93A5D|nr:hypothetical protein [Desulfuromonas sp.]PLX83808.1 MAG: hypothetical protein C0617_10260 [Desulfuromonas sp.]